MSIAATACALLGSATACAPAPTGDPAAREILVGDLDANRISLEQARQRHPRSAPARIELGAAYYRIARDALDRERDEARYLAFLERANEEFVTALELDPTSDQPHFYLGLMDVYRGDLRQALRRLDNARRLQPTGVAYTNIAELFIYQGELDKARRFTEVGFRKGAGVGVVQFNEMLMRWKEGDLRGAREHFDRLAAYYPDYLLTINVARLPQAPRRFEDFASYCCDSPACGPYMEEACLDLGLEARQREISSETVLKELRIEMETQRRLRTIYEQRKELEIEVEEPAP